MSGFVRLFGVLAVILSGLFALPVARTHAWTNFTVSTCDETSLRAAMSKAQAAGPDNTVAFSCSGTITLSTDGGGTIVLSQNLTIDGTGQSITISGGHSVGVFAVNYGVVFTVQQLTIADGGGTFNGGGIDNAGGTVNVTNSTLSGNSADSYGGAIYNSGTLNVTNSTLSGNNAPNGNGGAIYNFSGGIFNGSTANVTNSTLSGNSASNGYGGGIDNAGGTVNVTNSTLSGNSASNGYGGAVYNSFGTLNATNSTLSGNGASSGGGIFNDGSGLSTVTLANVIAASSPAGGNCFNSGGNGTIGDAGGNVDDGTSCGFSTANQSLSSTDPQLQSLADNGGPTQTMALASTSPAIGTGLAASCLSPSPVNNLDQRGQSRHADVRGACDSGAYDTGGNSLGAVVFATGFEPGQPQPSWTNTVDAGGYPVGGIESVGGICCGLGGPETGVRSEVANTGSVALMYSGLDMSASRSFAYLKVFDLSAQPITVGSGTVLSYWIYPQSGATSPVPVSGSNSTCVAIDVIFSDNTNLRDSGAVDQNGQRLHPAYQCGNLTLDAWNYVTSNIGSVAAGKSIVRIDVGYDQPGNTGGYRGYIDDISLQ